MSLFLEQPPSPVVIDALERHSPTPNPEHEGQWWRMQPNNAPDSHGYPLGTLVGKPEPRIPPREAVDIGLFHFDQLAEIGLPQPTIGHYYDEDRQRLYSLSHEITGLDGTLIRHGGESRHLEIEIGRCLLNYAGWVERTDQNFMLWDIDKYMQHWYGHTPVDLTDRLYMVDTDIFLARPEWWLPLFRQRVGVTFRVEV